MGHRILCLASTMQLIVLGSLVLIVLRFEYCYLDVIFDKFICCQMIIMTALTLLAMICLKSKFGSLEKEKRPDFRL